jgi:hypothetical protein
MRAVEDRLRDALAARAASVDPDDGLAAIEQRVAAVRRRQHMVRIGAVAVAAAVLGGAVLAVATLDDRRQTIEVRPSATTASPEPSTTSVLPASSEPPTTTALPASSEPPATTVITVPAPTATEPNVAPPPPATVTTAPSVTVPPTTLAVTPPTSGPAPSIPSPLPVAVWPAPGAAPFFSARAAALDAALHLVGMAPTAEVVGQARMTGSDTAVVDVRARPTGQVRTHVLTRRTPTGWVVNAVLSDDVILSEPDAMAPVAQTFAVAGQASAFEATIAVETRLLGAAGPAANRAPAMAGANGEIGPFTATTTLPDGVAAGQPAVLVVGVPDMSGDGDFTTAAIVPVVRAG